MQNQEKTFWLEIDFNAINTVGSDPFNCLLVNVAILQSSSRVLGFSACEEVNLFFPVLYISALPKPDWHKVFISPSWTSSAYRDLAEELLLINSANCRWHSTASVLTKRSLEEKNADWFLLLDSHCAHLNIILTRILFNLVWLLLNYFCLAHFHSYCL